MLIDPKKHRRRRAPSWMGMGDDRRDEGDPAPPVVLVALTMEVLPLRDLSEWMPCGVLLEEIPRAARGEGGLTMADVTRLRTWVANWTALVSDVRKFYTEHHADPRVERGLWYVLGSGRRPEGAALGELRRAYAEIHGAAPNIVLIPRPATQEPPR